MFHRFLVFIPLFSLSTLTRLVFWYMPLLVKWKKFILCSHIGSNNHVAYPSWIWYIWNDFVLISCTNETARLSYSKEPSLSLLCVHIMLMERSHIFLMLAFLFMQPCVLQLSQSSNNFTDQSALIAFKSQITFSQNDSVFAGGNWSTTTNFCD